MRYRHQNKVILVKGGCGLGKSSAYADLLTKNEWLDDKIIALPTNKAKRHIFEVINQKKTKDTTNKFMMTPDFEKLSSEVYKEVDRLQKIGAYEQLKCYIENYVFKYATDENKVKNILILNNYLKDNERVKDFANAIITTHTRAFYLTDKVYDTHSVIYDEDILNEAIKIIEIPIKAIEETLPNLKESKMIIQEKLELAINNKYRQVIPVESHVWYQDKIEAEIKESKKIYCNINDLLRCKAIARSNKFFAKTLSNPNGRDEDDTLWILVENTLPYRKSLVLSATADIQLYKDYFEKKCKRKLEIKETPKVENVGTIIQHYSYTYSKDCLRKNPEILETIREEHKEDLIILPKEFLDRGRKANGLEIEMGKLESIDELKGTNLVIVGLPNRSEIYHKMMEYAIYGVIHNEANMRNAWEENEFGKFQFFNYPEKYANLRRIRFWECEETLNQLIGRARLVLPENYQTIVHIYAKYPVENAIYMP
ncbi:MAG: hypothetical protein J6A89_04380 [Clostridia bacterium]|nr:hypothetical protein [Clostridia bacterium]